MFAIGSFLFPARPLCLCHLPTGAHGGKGERRKGDMERVVGSRFSFTCQVHINMCVRKSCKGERRKGKRKKGNESDYTIV